MQRPYHQQPVPERRPYEKPEIKRVALRPDEAVLGACKTAGGSGPVGPGTCGVNCSTAGS
jgi:hypothetical protein